MTHNEEYKNFISKFNPLLANKEEINWNEVSNYIDSFCAKINANIPNDGPKWSSPYHIKTDMTICVLAHGKKPMRALAVIDATNGEFKRLEPEEKKGFKGNSRKLKLTANVLELATTKRGFWVVLNTSLKYKYNFQNIKEQTDDILILYDLYVKNMDISPFTDERKKNAFTEQFDVVHYPNAEWCKYFLTEKKKSESKSLLKRKKKSLDFESKKVRICDLVEVKNIPKYNNSYIESASTKFPKRDVISIKEEINHITNETDNDDFFGEIKLESDEEEQDEEDDGLLCIV